MKFINFPGINGLGHTSSVKDSAKLLVPNIKTIPLNQDDIQIQFQQIYQETKSLISEEKLFIIGGDHSISYPIGLAFTQKYKNPGLIVFDAHADCMPPLTEPTHEEWLAALVTKTNIPTLIIGLRKTETNEAKFIEKHNIQTNPTLESIKEFCKDKDIYLSFDIDALDPTIAPATYYTEPNGLTLKQAQEFINVIPKNQIKLIDLVELHSNHDKDKLDKTIETTKELIDYLTR